MFFLKCRLIEMIGDLFASKPRKVISLNLPLSFILHHCKQSTWLVKFSLQSAGNNYSFESIDNHFLFSTVALHRHGYLYITAVIMDVLWLIINVYGSCDQNCISVKRSSILSRRVASGSHCRRADVINMTSALLDSVSSELIL